jgi:hypothetical protein
MLVKHGNGIMPSFTEHLNGLFGQILVEFEVHAIAQAGTETTRSWDSSAA